MHKFFIFLVTTALLAGLGVGVSISVTGRPVPASGGASAGQP
ncbi:hypothetical protein [Actinomadura sp. NBRC 104425]|nr:hypothetical protein [Actinomadura sp. NBRC 104425]